METVSLLKHKTKKSRLLSHSFRWGKLRKQEEERIETPTNEVEVYSKKKDNARTMKYEKMGATSDIKMFMIRVELKKVVFCVSGSKRDMYSKKKRSENIWSSKKWTKAEKEDIRNG